MSVQLGNNVLRLSSSLALRVDVLGYSIFCSLYVLFYFPQKQSYNSQLCILLCMTDIGFRKQRQKMGFIHQESWHFAVWIVSTSPRPQGMDFCVEIRSPYNTVMCQWSDKFLLYFSVADLRRSTCWKPSRSLKIHICSL